jgi:hypothetical protein
MKYPDPSEALLVRNLLCKFNGIGERQHLCAHHIVWLQFAVWMGTPLHKCAIVGKFYNGNNQCITHFSFLTLLTRDTSPFTIKEHHMNTASSFLMNKRRSHTVFLFILLTVLGPCKRPIFILVLSFTISQFQLRPSSGSSTFR